MQRKISVLHGVTLVIQKQTRNKELKHFATVCGNYITQSRDIWEDNTCFRVAKVMALSFSVYDRDKEMYASKSQQYKSLLEVSLQLVTALELNETVILILYLTTSISVTSWQS